jgi:hypothetical protein
MKVQYGESGQLLEPGNEHINRTNMQLILIYILWRFAKAICVGWTKDSHYHDR